MCFSVPVQVIESGPFRARCRHPSGEEIAVDVSLIDPPQPGDWLMSFLGTAREVVSEEEAKATLAVLAQLAAV